MKCFIELLDNVNIDITWQGIPSSLDRGVSVRGRGEASVTWCTGIPRLDVHGKSPKAKSCHVIYGGGGGRNPDWNPGLSRDHNSDITWCCRLHQKKNNYYETRDEHLQLVKLVYTTGLYTSGKCVMNPSRNFIPRYFDLLIYLIYIYIYIYVYSILVSSLSFCLFPKHIYIQHLPFKTCIFKYLLLSLQFH